MSREPSRGREPDAATSLAGARRPDYHCYVVAPDPGDESYRRDEPGLQMKLLTNRNGSYLTGDDLADAVLHYGLALARRREMDIVDIPFLAADGSVHRVQLTVGWNVDTTATSATGTSDELFERDTTYTMNAKTASLDVLRAHPFSRDEIAQMRWHVVDPVEWA